MTDLIERIDRLRSIVTEARELGSGGSEMQDDILVVCDEIERLQARVEALEGENSDLRGNRAVDKCTIENLRQALAATEQEKGE